MGRKVTEINFVFANKEKFYHLGYNNGESGERQPTFRMEISPASSGFEE
jgi:hypothetical protein